MLARYGRLAPNQTQERRNEMGITTQKIATCDVCGDTKEVSVFPESWWAIANAGKRKELYMSSPLSDFIHYVVCPSCIAPLV
jgi:hypothetical protein